MVALPTSASSTASWAPVDFLRLALRTDAAAGGRAQLAGDQLDQDELWLIDHMVTSCDSETATTLRLYQDGEDPARLLDGSAAGNFDVADWPAGLQVAPGATLIAVWSGASDGAVGTLTIQGRIMRKG